METRATTNKPIKLAIIYKIFNHYRKPIFDELDKVFSFLLLHSTNKTGIKNESATYCKEVRGFFYGKKSTQVWLFTILPLLKFAPDVIIHEFTPSIISLHISFVYARLFNRKFIIWGHGYNLSKGVDPFKKNKAKIRLFYLKKSDAVIVYGQLGKKKLSKYIDDNKIFVAQNTLDTDTLIKYRTEYDKIGKQKLKDTLGFGEFNYNLVYIGRLIDNKRPDLLIELNRYLSKRISSFAIHIIGGGKLKDKLHSLSKDNNFSNIYFYDAIYDEDIASKYLYVSDLMVMPGDLGLSVNHALCFDCPVVSFKQTSKGPFHGPEAEYIIDNETGFLAEPWNINEMGDWIISYLKDQAKQYGMYLQIRAAVKDVFPKDKMVSGIINSILYTLKS